VVELPINGRNVVGLAALLPGAADISAPQTTTDDRSGPTVSVSGACTNQKCATGGKFIRFTILWFSQTPI
jgi:hypothetical protein